jgi:hypothetical protein
MRGRCPKGDPTDALKKEMTIANRTPRRGLQKRPRGATGDVLLIAMLSQTLRRPSIQLGTALTDRE